MSSSYKIVISKLDEFIRKYYKNQLIRGLIYSLGLCLSFYIILVIAEYYGDFSIPLRTILFYSFAAGILYILGRFIAFPLVKLYNIGDVISYEEAAKIIGKHFTEVQDKLLNVLQLNSQLTVNSEQLMPACRADRVNSTLLEAGIEQKIRELKPIAFPQAIDISRNKKFIPYAAVPATVIMVAWLIVPSLLSRGTKQMFYYSTNFPKVAPFEFIIENNNLQAIQQKDFTLKLKLKGDEVPESVFIQYEGSIFKMEKSGTVSFDYVFRNLQHNETFTFNAAGYESQEYKLIALPEPQLAGFDIKLHFPAYINRKDEVIHNTGDLSIPQGTIVTWNFNANNTDNLRLAFGDSNKPVLLNSSSAIDAQQVAFRFSKRFMRSENYAVSVSNKYFTNHDSVKYVIQVIPDLYPSIDVVQKQDSTSSKSIYFNGKIKDDYGFDRLEFVYRIYNAGDSESNKGKIYNTMVSINKNITEQPFYFYWNTDTLPLSPGQQMEYYFVVWDNDGVNGPKSTKTLQMYFKIPALEEIQKNTEDNNSKVQNDISKTVQEAYMLQSQMEQERADLYNKQDMNWADKKKIDNLLNQQLDLEKKVEDISRQNKENNEKQWDYQKKDSDLVAKQAELQKLFDQLASDSLKKKLEELQKLMDKLNKNQVQEELDKLAMDNKDYKKELERTLDLFKQLDFQQDLKQNQQRLDSLAQRQEDLSKETKNKEIASNDKAKADTGQNWNPFTRDTSNSGKPMSKQAVEQELAKQQEQLNKDFNEEKNSLEELEKKNNELEEPTGFKAPEEQMQDVQNNQQNASQQISQKKNNKASQSQHSAAQGMQKMSDQLASMEMSMESEQQEEDLSSLRNILNNMVELSFEQEDLMGKVNNSGQGNLAYAEAAHRQNELQDKSATIADSLYKLSEHVMSMSGIVNQEMSKINYNMEQSVSSLEQRQGPEAAAYQQYSMTSINNLALMLSDVLAQMQAEANAPHKPGSGSCNKPGGMGQKMSMSDLQKMQDQLSQQLQQMKDAMQKQGTKPGGKTGNQNQGQNAENSEELAKMAAEQQYIREQMQQMEDMLNDKKQGGDLGNIAQDMDKNEQDILNRQITDATLQRQQQIIKNMLEYEKAKKTQGQSPDFESHTAKKQFFGNQNPFLQYNTEMERQDELLKTVPPDLNSFYRDKVTQYFNSFQ